MVQKAGVKGGGSRGGRWYCQRKKGVGNKQHNGERKKRKDEVDEGRKTSEARNTKNFYV